MAKLPIIGIAGKAGSGKDTVGNYLAKKYNAICIAQADPIKRFLMQVFYLKEDQLWGSRDVKEQPIEFNTSFITCNYYNLENNGAIGDVIPDGFKERAHLIIDKWLNDIITKLTTCGGLSPRFLMQTLGTECGREISEDMWSNFSIDSAIKLLNGGYTYSRTKGLEKSNKLYDYVCIPDIRFRNEATNLNKINASVWKTFRDTKEIKTGIKNHSSESELNHIPKHFYDEIIDNNKTLRQLYYEIDSRMAVNYGDTRVWR